MDTPGPKTQRLQRRSVTPDDADQRRTDASLILSVVHATRTWQEETGRTAPVKPLRELLWTVWEQPRLPRPVHRGKYPLSVPWTPAARAAYADNPKAPLSIEHVVPASVFVRSLLASPPANNAALVRVLNAISYVVIAPEDNQLLNAAGVGAKLAPGSADPLDRYRLAGLDPSQFSPLQDAAVGPPALPEIQEGV